MALHGPVPDRLDGRVALITGSTRGIGRGIAERFAREGAHVVVNDEGGHDGTEIAAELREVGSEAIYVEADACDPDAIDRLIETVVEEYGRIDVLVNNVGTWRHQPLTETAVEDWDYVFDGTVRSHWLTTKHAIEHMPAGGSIVNVSSIHALAADPGRFPYNVAKTAVNALTRTFAVELGVLGVRANAVMPGPVPRTTLDPDDEVLREHSGMLPVRRRGVPDDIAAPVAFLASEEASFLTGAVIPVDGGWMATFTDDAQREWHAARGRE